MADTPMWRTIPASHPALPGHFPGHPIVPGVVLMSEVWDSITAAAGRTLCCTGWPSVKFLAPLRPEEPFLEAGSAYRLQATGALQKGTDTQKIYNMEASVNAQNAKVAHTYAEWTMRKVEQDVYKVQTGASVQVGQQVAAYASGNVDVGVGTPVNVYASTAASAERTSNWLRLAAAEEAYGLNHQAKQYVQLAAIDRYKGAAAVTASKYEAAGMEYAARGQQYAAAGALYAQSGALLGQQGALLAARGAEVARGGLLWQKMAVLAGGQAQAAAYNAGAISDFMGAAAGASYFP